MTYLTPESKFEEWRAIPGLETTHEVSSQGRIRRIKQVNGCPAGTIIKAHPNQKGYLQVKLASQGQVFRLTVHGAVAAAFIGARPLNATINHKDGVKSHNSPANLEYLTHRENIMHAIASGLRTHAVPKLTDDSVRQIRALQGVASSNQIASQFGVSGGTVRSLWLGLTWKHVL